MCCHTLCYKKLSVPATINDCMHNRPFSIILCIYYYYYIKEVFVTIDVDECIEGMHSCSQICVNLEGSYRCACKTGYQLNKGTCEGIAYFLIDMVFKEVIIIVSSYSLNIVWVILWFCCSVLYLISPG